MVSDEQRLFVTLLGRFDWHMVGAALLPAFKHSKYSPCEAPLGRLAWEASLKIIISQSSGLPRFGKKINF